MTTVDAPDLAAIVEDAGLSRVLHDLDGLARRFDRLTANYGALAQVVPRGALPSPAPSLDSLRRAYPNEPYLLQSLLQAIAFSCSDKALLTIALSNAGCTIGRITLDYTRRKAVTLDIALQLLDGKTEHSFSSDDVWDLAVLRMLGLSTSGGTPLVDGFFPLHISA